ncbi:hypothetical protein [Streptomyces iconiensis]|uniref:N-acetyltransferase n=1 Tax=Streptomyces iconiensis TaxID=1384038 RepID=A0ABT6ZQ92_9ACTN|nr:hypothetical protein [Streptomyces iconiensis]MDJ1131022.1 hypothetical protein [Streptomyces iconiensis]
MTVARQLTLPAYEVALPHEAPGLAAQVAYEPLWPRFLFAAPSMRLYSPLAALWPYAQLLLAAPESGRLLGWLDTAPAYWDGDDEALPGGWDALMERAVEGLRAGRAPDTLAMMSLSLLPSARGKGLGSACVELVRTLAALLSLRAALAPVRPTRKCARPREPMADYIRCKRPDGLPEDPWLRTHVRAGGRVVGVAAESTVMEAPLTDWRRWGAALSPDGVWTIEGALAPLEPLPDGCSARYTEPNVWVVHTPSAPPDLSPARTWRP